MAIGLRQVVECYERRGLCGVFARFDEILTRQKQYILVIDAKQASMPTAKQRRMLTEYVSQVTPISQKYCVASVTLLASKAAEAIHTALYWISPAHSRERVFTNPRDGAVWLCQTAKTQNFALPAGMDAQFIVDIVSVRDK